MQIDTSFAGFNRTCLYDETVDATLSGDQWQGERLTFLTTTCSSHFAVYRGDRLDRLICHVDLKPATAS